MQESRGERRAGSRSTVLLSGLLPCLIWSVGCFGGGAPTGGGASQRPVPGPAAPQTQAFQAPSAIPAQPAAPAGGNVGPQAGTPAAGAPAQGPAVPGPQGLGAHLNDPGHVQ